MSADNYYLVRKHPLGGFTAVMGFDSYDEDPIAHESDRQFDTVELAQLYGYLEYSEYGVRIHPECYESVK